MHPLKKLKAFFLSLAAPEPPAQPPTESAFGGEPVRAYVSTITPTPGTGAPQPGRPF